MPMRPNFLPGLVALSLTAIPARAPAQEPLTLQRAIELAQSQGNQAVAARASRDAAVFRDRAFSARQLPQLSLGGTLPRYNRAIIPVVQPDGSTLFRPQNQTDAGLTATITQQLPTGAPVINAQQEVGPGVGGGTAAQSAGLDIV